LAIPPILTKHLTVANKMLLESVNDTMANLLLRNYWPGEQELCVRCLNVERSEVNGIEFRNATLETAIGQLLKGMQVVKKVDIRISNNVFIPGLKDLLLRAMKAMAIANLLFATYPFYLGLAAGLIQQARNSLKTVEVHCYANWMIRMPEDADYSDCRDLFRTLGSCQSLTGLQIMGVEFGRRQQDDKRRSFLDCLQNKSIRSLEIYGGEFWNWPGALQLILTMGSDFQRDQ